MRMFAGLKQRSKILWCVVIARFGPIGVAQHRFLEYQTEEWVTIDLPNPVSPLPVTLASGQEPQRVN